MPVKLLTASRASTRISERVAVQLFAATRGIKFLMDNLYEPFIACGVKILILDRKTCVLRLGSRQLDRIIFFKASHSRLIEKNCFYSNTISSHKKRKIIDSCS